MPLILPDHARAERLISEEYRRQQTKLHENPDYGVASTHFAPMVAKVCNQYAVHELLDYGCGKGRLAETLMRDRLLDHPMRLQQYDPAVPEVADLPDPCQMVTCIDVLEHIEPELLDNVLDDLQRVTQEIGLFTVSTMPAMKTLDDGRNAHLIVEGAEFWLPRFMARFDLHVFQKTSDGFMVLVMANAIERN